MLCQRTVTCNTAVNTVPVRPRQPASGCQPPAPLADQGALTKAPQARRIIQMLLFTPAPVNGDITVWVRANAVSKIERA